MQRTSFYPEPTPVEAKTYEPPNLDVRDVAELLGVAPSTVYAWAKTRTAGPPSYRVGNFVRFRRSEVIAWLEAQRSDSTPATSAS